MVVTQGDVFWADLPAPVGSGPGFRRPVVVIQSDAFNRSRIATVLVIPLTSNLSLAAAPGARVNGVNRVSVYYSVEMARAVRLEGEVSSATSF